MSRLCLGTMLMGTKTPPAEAHEMLDAFIEAGHNFLDTADVYGDGLAGEILRPWLARRRDEVVITTKVRFHATDPGGEGLAPERIRKACDASLRRMGTDVIDLSEVHAPDPIVGPRTMGQLRDLLPAATLRLSADQLRRLGGHTAPPQLYPHRFLSEQNHIDPEQPLRRADDPVSS